MYQVLEALGFETTHGHVRCLTKNKMKKKTVLRKKGEHSGNRTLDLGLSGTSLLIT